MDKTMTRFLAILAALTCAASAQTYRTVTAGTNNVIRTNFTLAFPQITFAGGSSNSVPVVSGGTGATNAAQALVNLLPSYTGNSNAVLSLNSNATSIVWSTNAGGGLPETPLSVTNGGTGGTNRESALGGLGVFTVNGGVRLDTNSNIAANSRHITIGNDIVATNTNFTSYKAVAIGDATFVTFGGVAIGQGADTEDGNSIGRTTYSKAQSVAIGYNASAIGADGTSGEEGGVAIGWGTVSFTNGGGAVGRSAGTYGGGAIGDTAFTRAGGAIGFLATSSNGIAGGSNAWTRDGVALGPNSRTTNGVQLLTGTNTVSNSIQLLSSGSIDTNEWSHLAALSTYPTTNISVVGTNNTNTLVFSNGILTSVTSP